MLRFATLLGCLAACATHDPPGAPPGANTITGTVGGQTLTIADAAWVVAPATLSSLTGQAAFIVMSTESDLCARLGSNTVVPGERTIRITLVDIAGTAVAAPSAPGSYTVPIESTWAPKTGWLDANSYDAACNHTGVGGARAGEIAVTAVDATALTGTLDVQFTLNNAPHVTGAFAPQFCPALATMQDALPACQ